MNLTTRDLGVEVEEWTYRHEYRRHAVEGLPDGVKAMIVEDKGRFSVVVFDVPRLVMDAPPRQHDAIGLALEELSEYVSSLTS